jgi:predicted O-methyltransferase YrrM
VVHLAELRAQACECEGEHRCWDVMAVELETADFLYALVRLLKPRLVLESGTGRGYASAFIGTALADNGYGTLITYEPLQAFADEARTRLVGLPVDVRDGDLSAFDGTPDVVFLDSGPAYREREIAEWVARDVVLIVHDATRYELEGGTMLATPRGLWVRT